MHAVVTSVGLHAAAFAFFLYANAEMDMGGQAKAPVSMLLAHVFTYQKGEAMDAPATQEIVTSSSEALPAPQDLSAESARPPKPPAEPNPVPVASEAVPDSAALDASPVLVSSVTLEYPLSANNREGVVTLAIVIAGDGHVEDVTVVKAVPAGFFEAAALAGFRAARFTPGLLGGIGVKSRMLVEVEFMPTNRGGAVSGQK